MRAAPLEVALRRERWVVAGVIVFLSALAWCYILWLAADMRMGGMDMSGWRMIPAGMRLMVPASTPWSATEFAVVLVMWMVMMVGMMLPSAAPMLLLYARIARQGIAQGNPFAATGWFATGYLLVWWGFSLAATAAQWALERLQLLNADMAGTSRMLGAVVLLAAGAYQWSGFKRRCLTNCQSPLTFIQRQGGFRRAARGALLMGVRHGTYCLGCCWLLMLLLFVVGVMNVLWIAILATVTLLEKLLPPRWHFARVTGCLLIVAGVAMAS